MSTKRYQDMNAKELRSATREFDSPVSENQSLGRPLTATEWAHFESLRKGHSKASAAKALGTGPARATRRAKPKSGLPLRRGAASRVVSLRMEASLLRKLDAQAKAHGLSRSQWVALRLRSLVR